MEESEGRSHNMRMHAMKEEKKEKDVDIANYFRGGRDADVHDVTRVCCFYHW